MGQIIYFPKNDFNKEDALKVKNFSDAIDQVVLNAIRKKRVPPQEIAGVLSHRLGALLKSIDEKKRLWHICGEITKQQAEID